MSVISKDLANKISFRLTEKSKAVTDSLYENFRLLVVEAYKDTIPGEVMSLFKKLPEYIETTDIVRIEGSGFSRQWVSINGQLPGDGNFKFTGKVAEKLMSAKRKHEDSQKKYNELRRETESALLALKTHANIRKELPAAIPFLPPPMSNALVCNFQSLNKKLNKQPEIKNELAVS